MQPERQLKGALLVKESAFDYWLIVTKFTAFVMHMYGVPDMNFQKNPFGGTWDTARRYIAVQAKCFWLLTDCN